ncbi:GNAT family N-acetyltransferase [Methylocystis sp. B8]|uniref:GNAT family N-acetyltransferase n=1 Tax=Methylocystis sp. B8 TaxID=544938 RepID=UPI0010FD3B82|nr:GNAT family N-acetyltransferase [Methylocystis sp. B8]TLG78843.1 GNAT family N-acetyltransferase [Methylocystis sp. B8]
MIKNEVVEKIAFSIESAESAELAARLGEEVAAQFGARDERPLSIVARDAQGAFVGGLNGVSHWRWLYVRHLWVEKSQRGRGLGRRVMTEAERLAQERGCVGVYVDTFDPQAAAFYEALGFTRAGKIVGFPPGHARLFFRKLLR